MSTLVQEVLRSGTETLASLQAKYALKVNRHGKYPNLVMLKYDQIESQMGERIVQECRGIILDEAQNWECIARPFNKFFNHGEGHAAPVDWSTARVQEKLDGSLIILYWYDGAWQVATSGTPDASGQVNGFDFTFADLFRKVWTEEMGWDWPVAERHSSRDGARCGSMAIRYTYMWELCTAYNRVVVRHEKPSISLIGIRSPENGEELDVEKTRSYYQGQFPNPVRSFGLQSLDEVVGTFSTMDPCTQEGFVVVDTNFNRIKVKHPGYVALHHLRDGMGTRRLLEIARASESDEFLAHFPEWKPAYDQVRERYDALIVELQDVYDRNCDIPVQKDFALVATKTRYGSALFALRAGKAKSLREYFSKINIKHLMETLKIKEIEL